MANKFFQKPQLQQARLSESQQTGLSGRDVQAEQKAQQAAKSIDTLAGIANTVSQGAIGAYQENIDAKNRLASKRETPFFLKHMEEGIAQTENFESLGREGIQQKYMELSESFLEKYKDKPHQSQMRQDIAQLESRMLGNMLQKRDAMHSQIVNDATIEAASTATKMFAEGLIDSDQLAGRLSQSVFEATVAFQVPSSSELELDDDARTKYQGLTRKQANEALLKGVVIQSGSPNNSKVAQLMDNEAFRELMGISKDDQDYNKAVAIAYKKGAKADKVNYESNLDGLKEGLYAQSNQGFIINVDKEVQEYRDSGKELSSKDEASIRKTFIKNNKVILSSGKYVDGLLKGKDLSAGMTRKERESVYERSFTDILDINAEGINIDAVNGALSTKAGQVAFSDYIKSGGKIPDKFVQMFDVPAGASSQKWEQASIALASMQAAAAGSGQSVEEIVGVKSVAKVRGMARILNDPEMEGSVKQNAIEALQTQSTSFNSKGYLKGTSDTSIDTEWLNETSKDAPWTTDDYVSDLQNADEIAGNYQAYRLAGNSDEDAKELALDLFNKSNTSFEMSNGGEIAIPVKHKYINNVSIDEFSKSVDKDGNPRFPSLQQQRADLEITTGDGVISEWRARTNISFQKSYNFGKTGKYDMLYNGRLVERSSFSYEELEEFISNSPSKLREKMTKEKHVSFSEAEESAFESRSRKIKNRQEQDHKIEHVFDLKI